MAASPLDPIRKYLAIDPVTFDRVQVARQGLWAFIRAAWPEVESDPLVPGWHMEEIAKHLEAVSRGDLTRLLINIPPGCSKSTLVSVLWPAWDWIAHPSRKWMVATFDANLMRRDALRCRGLVASRWYQARWGDRVGIEAGEDVRRTQDIYETSAGGRRVSLTVEAGKGTGWHAEIQVVDDPTKPKDVTADPDVAGAALERAWTWWTATMATRRSNPKHFVRVIIMQRLHENDLVGRILESDKEHQWTHLMLPMAFEPDRRCVTPWGGDHRTREGELLCPARFDEAALAEIRRELGGQQTAAQLQQRPAPAGGNLFQRAWFDERWTELPADMVMVQSWDLAFKATAGADYVAGHVWGFCRGKYYLVDRVHERLGLPETIKCIEAMARRWPTARAILIEDKANGPAVEQMLRGRMTGIIMVTPEGGKVARANAVSPLCEAGNVVLPDPNVHRWADDVFEELATFPFARHDDDVDAMTQALAYLHAHNPARYIEAMDRVRRGEWSYQ